MEREPKRIEPSKERQEEEKSNSLPSLEVTNEVRIPPVRSAAKSGCGRCG